MKTIILLCAASCLSLFIFIGCGRTDTTETLNHGTEALAGFIEIHDSMLHINLADVFVIYNAGDAFGFVRDTSIESITFIERNDTQKMSTFGLTFENFSPSWYYIANRETETRSFKITGKTEFVFISGGEQHTTNEVDLFMPVLFPSVVHFIEVQDNTVIRVIQEFGFTM